MESTLLWAQAHRPPGCSTATALHRSARVLPPALSWTPHTPRREDGTGLTDRWWEGEEGRGRERERGEGGLRVKRLREYSWCLL